jgi:hypothetical protein
MHCDLEHVPGFQFLAWCHPPDAAPHEDHNDCSQDGCSVVESGLYRIEEQPAVLRLPLGLLSFALPAWEAPLTQTPAPLLGPPTGSPPALPRGWQFLHRTALPPRAPSSVA